MIRVIRVFRGSAFLRPLLGLWVERKNQTTKHTNHTKKYTKQERLDKLTFFSVLTSSDSAAISYLTYISHTKYIVCAPYSIESPKDPPEQSEVLSRTSRFMAGHRIKFRIEEILRKREQSLYWLARTTGVSYTTLWRLTKDRSLGVNFATLEKLCDALRCGPGDLLQLESDSKEKSKTKTLPARTPRRVSSPL